MFRWKTSTLMLAAALLVSVGTAIIAAGVAVMPATTVPVPVSEPLSIPTSGPYRLTGWPEYLAVESCEDLVSPVGPCVMWDEGTNDAPGATTNRWYVEPLAQTYPNGAFRLPECANGTGVALEPGDVGAPCVWIGNWGADVPSTTGSPILVFGGVV